MLLTKLIEGLEVVSIEGDINRNIASVEYDSRKVRSGSMFVCIEGTKTDGHRFVPDAVQSGAAALLVEKDVEAPIDVTVIKTPNTRYALAHVSANFYGHPSRDFHLTGVTGTKGKTTTTYMLKAMLEAENRKTGLIGTIANMVGSEILYAERTTPESKDLQSLFAYMKGRGVSNVVMEVSSHALDLHRVSCSDYDIGIFTNLSRDHLDYHKTFENYFEAKMKLFNMCKQAVVNIDDEYGRKVAERAKCKVYTFGLTQDADIRAENLSLHSDSVEFRVITPWMSTDVYVNIPGKFTVYNALGAIGACCLMGLGTESIKNGLKNVSVPGRAEVVETDRDFTVMIDYAHSPESLKSILETVRDFAPGRVVCLFGCGGDRDKTKRPIMGEISGKLADFTIVTSDNPRTEDPAAIVKDIEEGIKKVTDNYITIVDRKEAIRYALSNARPGDLIVLAGKGHETYQQFSDKTIHFDEREIVREILCDL